MREKLFDDTCVDLKILRKRAVSQKSLRWGSIPEGYIPLTSADPDFPPAPEVRRALIRHIEGAYFPYAPSDGIEGLCESLSRGMLERKGYSVPQGYIQPVDSASAAMQAAAHAVLQPGDEAIVFDPVDLLFGISVRHAGGKVVYYPSVYQDGHWKLDDLEDYVTPRTRLLCLCNPHNPMGLLYSREELQHIAEVALRHGLYILNDEIWSDIVYSEKPFVSINSLGPEMNPRTVTVYGFSKGFAIPGLRAGYFCTLCPEPFEKVLEVCGAFAGVDILTQVAMKTCFDECFDWVDAFCRHLQGNRDYLHQRLSQMPFVDAHRQEATFVSFIDISSSGLSSQEMVDYLHEKYHVLLVPGTEYWFGPRAAGHVRLCYSTSRAILKEGLDRIERALCDLQAGKKG